MTQQKFVAATRFYESNLEKAAQSFQNLQRFIGGALDAGAEHVLIAVNVAEDKSPALNLEAHRDGVTIFPVQPWGFFVQPLNALLVQGRGFWKDGANILIASVEVALTGVAAQTLNANLDENTLVVGAALEGHDYSPGIHEEANGREVPWNTLALWQARQLWRTGVPLIGDGPVDQPDNKGVEELVTLAVQQHFWPHIAAKLIPVPGQEWDTSHFDEERRARHEKKMASKVSRPAAQLAEYGINGPTVIHL